MNANHRYVTVPILTASLVLLFASMGLPQDQTGGTQSGTGTTGEFTVRPESPGPLKLEAQPPSLSPEERKRLEEELKKTHLPVRPRPPSDTDSGPGPPAMVPTPTVPPTTPQLLPNGERGNIAPMALEDFTFARNVGLDQNATGGLTSLIAEPSVANIGNSIYGDIVFQTGNWYAALSVDGLNFSFVDPFTTFPPANGGFCCDQVTIYDPSRDLLFWLLQYIKDPNRNTQRLAVIRGVRTGTNLNIYYYDLTPDGLNTSWTNQWFDFPDLALGNNSLYITTNVFRTDDCGSDGTQCSFVRSVIMRLPLDSLAAGSTVTVRYFDPNDSDIFAFRVAQGIRGTAYWGAHKLWWFGSKQIRIYRWEEGALTVSWNDISVSSWNYLYSGLGSCPGPGGIGDWCGRADSRILGAWVSNGVIGFMWNAKQGSSRPFPYIKVARFSESTRALINEPDIWSNAFVFLYPAVAPNARGHLGVSLFAGGINYYSIHGVCIADDLSGAPPPWECYVSSISTHGPNDNVWGDYLTVRPHYPNTNTWSGTGYSLQGGSGGSSIVPQYLYFGRRRDFDTVIFQDNMESGPGSWSAQPPWGLTVATAHTPTHSWSDSPSGNYGNTLNVSLFSPTLSFSGFTSVTLTFWHRYDLESGYDFGRVWVTTDNGATWTLLSSFTGTNTTWHQATGNLNAFAGRSTVQIAFQLWSDFNVTRDGWYIDDVVVSGSQ